MTEQAILKEIVGKAAVMAKEISRGKDIYITKSASGVVVKKMTVEKA